MAYNHEDTDKLNNLVRARASTNGEDGQIIMDQETMIHHNHEDSEKLRNDVTSVAFRLPTENSGYVVPKEKMPLASPTSFYKDPTHHVLLITVSTFLIAASLLLLFITSRSILRQRRSKKVKRSIYGHLLAFDVEDIDLNKAYTGGWHGTYQNLLAQGKERERDQDSVTTDIESSSSSFRSHSSVLLQDSIFMDNPDLTTSPNTTSTSLFCDIGYYSDSDDDDDNDDNEDAIFSSVKAIVLKNQRPATDTI